MDNSISSRADTNAETDRETGRIPNQKAEPLDDECLDTVNGGELKITPEILNVGGMGLNMAVASFGLFNNTSPIVNDINTPENATNLFRSGTDTDPKK